MDIVEMAIHSAYYHAQLSILLFTAKNIEMLCKKINCHSNTHAMKFVNHKDFTYEIRVHGAHIKHRYVSS